MKMKKILILAFLFFSASTAFPKEPSWLINLKRLTPLQSTQKDVENIFGSPSKYYGDEIIKYKTKIGVLDITYSTGNCNEIKNNIGITHYNVGKGVVTYIDFELNKPIKFKPLGINVSNFEKEESSDTPNLIYKSKTLGMDYGIYIERWKEPELLTSISIYPSENFSYLECSE